MVSGWRRVFCTSVKKEELELESRGFEDGSVALSPKVNSRFRFFSPRFRLHGHPESSPNLRCHSTAADSPTPSSSSAPATPFFNRLPPSHKSPVSSFKSTSHLPLKKCDTCGGVFHSETTTFSTESSRNRADCSTCPSCCLNNNREEDVSKKQFRVYDDDESLISPSPRSVFTAIPEEDDDDAMGEITFEGTCSRSPNFESPKTPPEIAILPQSAVISVGRNHETLAVVLKVRAPHQLEFPPDHAPLDLVALLDLTSSSSSLSRIKFAMGILISSLRTVDRLSIVVFASGSKRLLPLRRMTNAGRRAARRVVDMVATSGSGMCVRDALKKAAKVLADRRERNPRAAIVVVSPAHGNGCEVTTTAHSSELHLLIPTHWFSLGEADARSLSKSVHTILTVSLHDVTLSLQHSPGTITAVYPLKERPVVFPADSVRLGDMHGGEERELLTEIKVPRSTSGDNHALHVRASYKCPFDNVISDDQSFVIPNAEPLRSAVPGIQRLRNIHVVTKAAAEWRRLAEKEGDVLGGYHLLSSAISVMMQSGDESAGYCRRRLEEEMSELHRRWRQPDAGGIFRLDAAEKLAKVASFRKHLKRVCDLHGFENARF